jgi:hypothetical protein
VDDFVSRYRIASEANDIDAGTHGSPFARSARLAE